MSLPAPSRTPLLLLVGAGFAAAAVGTAVSVAIVRFVGRGRSYAEDVVPGTPVALVFGAQVFPDGTPSPFLAARLDLALRLWRAGRVQRFLLSGDGAAPEYDEPLAMRVHLERQGVPAGLITEDPYGLDTYASCRRARDVYGVHRLTVVTQAYHLPRALGTAVLAGLDPVGVGDQSCRPLRRSWRKGAVRDQPACVKTLLDLVRDRLLP